MRTLKDVETVLRELQVTMTARLVPGGVIVELARKDGEHIGAKGDTLDEAFEATLKWHDDFRRTMLPEV